VFTALNTYIVYTDQLFLRNIMFSCLRPHWKWSPRTEPESVWLHDIRWLEHCTDPRHFLHIVTYSRISEYLKLPGSILSSLHLTDLYGVSQEECARFRESVPYVILYRYNPKHLCPKLNGYGDNSQRKVWASSESTYCMPSVTSYLSNAPARQLDIVMEWPWRVRYSAR